MFKLKMVKGNGKKIYQYQSGEYLPDSSQPSPNDPTFYALHLSTRYMNVAISEGNHMPMRRDSKGQLVDCEKELPELYSRREECCGCSACYTVCPMSGMHRPPMAQGENRDIEVLISANSETIERKEHTGAITMLPDEKGFLYPVIDAQLCIRCYQCLGVCLFHEKQANHVSFDWISL